MKKNDRAEVISMKKNDLVEVKIEDIGMDGEGIGKVDGYTLFVKDAVIGDVIEAKITKAKKNYGYARMINIKEPSPYRIEAKCPVARQCGGCQIQEMSYDQQLIFKENKIRNNLIRIGKFENPPMEPIIGMKEPFYYRNKAQFPIGTDKDGNIIAGFYAGRTHDIIPNRKCFLGVDINETILDKVIDYMNENKVSSYNETTGKGLVRHVLIRYGFRTKEIMVCIIVNGKSLPNQEELIKSLCELEGMTSITLNVNREKTNVILGREIVELWGKGYIEDYIGDVKYQISPLSFYQVNPAQTEKLYGTALEYAGLTGNETVWDLYCGIGTISLFLAQRAKQVYGVEIVPEAIEDARRNAKLNGIENAEFYLGKSEEVLPKKLAEENVKADVIVVDPPRKGCEEALLKAILEMGVPKVVYVSCDSATLARDLRYLCDGGYEVERVRGVDMFGNSGHVETVVLLSKLKSAKSIEVKIELDEMDLTIAESKATYDKIKQYVLDKTGLKVSQLYIAQVKRKHGLIERINYNVGDGKAKVPQVPLEKEEAIEDALRHFKMI